jgi:hypothetical protein
MKKEREKKKRIEQEGKERKGERPKRNIENKMLL